MSDEAEQLEQLRTLTRKVRAARLTFEEARAAANESLTITEKALAATVEAALATRKTITAAETARQAWCDAADELTEFVNTIAEEERRKLQ